MAGRSGVKPLQARRGSAVTIFKMPGKEKGAEMGRRSGAYYLKWMHGQASAYDANGAAR